jgi:hypothetical protein
MSFMRRVIYAEYCYAECRGALEGTMAFSITTLSMITLGTVIQVSTFSVIQLGVVLLSAQAPI